MYLLAFSAVFLKTFFGYRMPVRCWSINFTITTACNLACPDCCCNIPSKPSRHISLADMETAAALLAPIERVNLTGGEATLHPQFDVISQFAKVWFRCARLTVETNAARSDWHRVAEALARFDEIVATEYTAATYPGCPVDNRPNIEALRRALPSSRILVSAVRHVPRHLRPGTKPCSLGTGESVAYCDGLLWPCCVAPGIPEAVGIPVTANWREEIARVSCPCAHCWFAG